MYRLHPSWVAVREMVDGGRIGPLTAVHSWFSYYNDDPTDIRNIADAGGGALYDIGCYCVNLSRMLFGAEPRRVAAAIIRDPGNGTDVLTSGLLEFDGGTATFTCSTRAEDDQQVHVYGTTAGSRSGSRSTSRPTGRRRSRSSPAATRRSRPSARCSPSRPRTRTPSRPSSLRRRSSMAGRRPSTRGTRSPTCASWSSSLRRVRRGGALVETPPAARPGGRGIRARRAGRRGGPRNGVGVRALRRRDAHGRARSAAVRGGGGGGRHRAPVRR